MPAVRARSAVNPSDGATNSPSTTDRSPPSPYGRRTMGVNRRRLVGRGLPRLRAVFEGCSPSSGRCRFMVEGATPRPTPTASTSRGAAARVSTGAASLEVVEGARAHVRAARLARETLRSQPDPGGCSPVVVPGRGEEMIENGTRIPTEISVAALHSGRPYDSPAGTYPGRAACLGRIPRLASGPGEEPANVLITRPIAAAGVAAPPSARIRRSTPRNPGRFSPQLRLRLRVRLRLRLRLAPRASASACAADASPALGEGGAGNRREAVARLST